jgi:biopolymer transport protein ExbB/TolQ
MVNKTLKIMFVFLILMIIISIPVIGIPLFILIVAYWLMKNYIKVFRGYKDLKEEWNIAMNDDEKEKLR